MVNKTITEIKNFLPSYISNFDFDILYTKSIGQSISFADDKLEIKDIDESIGISIRIFKNKKFGFVYTNKFSKDIIRNLIDSAIRNCQFSPQEEYNILPSVPNRYYQEIKTVDNEILQSQFLVDEKKLKEFDKYTIDNYKSVKKILRISYGQEISEIGLLNSQGLELTSSYTSAGFGIACITEKNGEIQIGAFGKSKRFFQDLNFFEIIKEAVWRGESLLGAKKIPSGDYEIVLDPLIGCEFLDFLSFSLCADNVQKNKSKFKNKKNTKVLDEKITIIDDATLPNEIGSYPFDAEGYPGQRTILIENGILKNFIYDFKTSIIDNTKSTGNATRSFSSLPEPDYSNIFLQPGNTKRDDLIAKTKKALYITEVIGMHTADPVSGDFSVGANGIMIENGSFAYPFGHITITGNIYEIFNNVVEISSELNFYGSTGVPLIKISNLSISGE